MFESLERILVKAQQALESVKTQDELDAWRGPPDLVILQRPGYPLFLGKR